MHTERDSHPLTLNRDHEKDLAAATNEAREDAETLNEAGKLDAVAKLSPFEAYFRLWTYADPLDVVLRVIATAAALGGGTAYPLMTIVFGNLVNYFNDRGVNVLSSAEFRSRVN